MTRMLKLLAAAFMLFCFINTTYAGSPGPEAPPPPVSVDYTGVYVDLAAGYAFVDWQGTSLGAFNNFNQTLNGIVSSNSQGGFSFGADVGYQLNRYLALEAGWYYLPTVTGNSDVVAQLPALEVKSWIAYLSAKLMAPIWGNLYVFGKVGAGYRSLRYHDVAITFSNFGGSTNQYWCVLFAAGLQYWFGPHWTAAIQYLHFPRYSDGNIVPRQAPTAHLVMASVGYKFGL